jgi:hypothetical protein
MPKIDEYGNVTIDIEYTIGSATFSSTLGWPIDDWPQDEDGQRDIVQDEVQELIQNELDVKWTVREVGDEDE